MLLPHPADGTRAGTAPQQRFDPSPQAGSSDAAETKRRRLSSNETVTGNSFHRDDNSLCSTAEFSSY